MRAGELHIYYCRVDAVDPALFDSYAALLDVHEQRRMARFHVEAARHEYLLSRALLRTALAVQLGATPRALRFAADANGKPQLAAPFAGWHFNLSHSAEWVALALGNAGPVGIDIESHARANDLAAIARRFFSAEEIAVLARDPADSPAWLERFFAIWTLKEAHAKALGCGLSRILSCSGFVPDARLTATSPGSIELHLTGAAAAAVPVATWLYRPDARTSLAVSQLGAQAVIPTLRNWLPLPDGTARSHHRELAPIATGNWRPVTQNANPCA